MDNDALDFVDQLKRAVIAILIGLRRLAPGSRMALAAEARAGAVAAFERMMPARTLIAVRVWLRASERISVRDFGIQAASKSEPDPSGRTTRKPMHRHDPRSHPQDSHLTGMRWWESRIARHEASARGSIE